MTLGYSQCAYAEGFLHERMTNLLNAHENAFAHFGGRCEQLLYDRLPEAVNLDEQADGACARPLGRKLQHRQPVHCTILNSTRRSSASTASSLPVPTMFCLKPMPCGRVRLAKPPDSAARRCLM